MSEVYSRAFLYGESAFTTLRVHEGKPSFLEAHKDRLLRSSEWLWPGTNLQVTKLVSDVLSRIPKGEGVWRLTLHQEGERGVWRPNSTSQISLTESWSQGLKPADPLNLKTVEAQSRSKNWPSFLKSSDYLSRIVAARGLSHEFEPLFYTTEGIAELMFANIVFWNGKTFITPPAGPNVLSGIGLSHLRVLLNKMGFHLTEQNIFNNQLSQFQSAFAVNAVKGLIKVESIDGNPLQAHPSEQELVRSFFDHE